MAILDSLKFILPKKKAKTGGTSTTGTYVASKVVTLPVYRDHLTNITNKRLNSTTRDLLKYLAKHDPDVSATFHAYFTISNSSWVMFVKDSKGQLDRKGQELLQTLVQVLTRKWDYSLGFEYKRSLDDILDEFKYSIMLRGSISAELVLDKLLNPAEIRTIDSATVEWLEKKPGAYKPIQKTTVGDDINLDIPTFFYKAYRRDPSEMYTDSMFVSCITTIVSRIQIMNDLYAIMQVTGYPRLTLEVLEEVAVKNAPADVRKDPARLRNWISNVLETEANKFATVTPQNIYAHPDSIQPKILNEKSPGVGLKIEELIETLNAQNQAALKVVPTVIGRGEKGVNTASVEARIFSLAADSLNKCVAETVGEILTLAMRLQGYDGSVDFWYRSIELRPELELESQKLMRQARLLEELSLGLITDEEYHLKMHGRLANKAAVELSGTNFVNQKMETKGVSPNSDPLGRSLTPKDSESANSNTVDKGKQKG